jgi:uroporphyrin-III C-methyltransferase
MTSLNLFKTLNFDLFHWVRLLEKNPTQRKSSATSKHSGGVALVGAGPGDPDLMTRKGWKLLISAQVIVYDALVSQELLDEIPAPIRRIYVGKRKGRHSRSQQDINQLLVELAQQGLQVVRLKGGDPLIFGRVTEEIEALKLAGIQWQLVPGITAAAGCAAQAGFSLTERRIAPSLRLVTAHSCDERPIDWAKLACRDETLVFYMGLSKVEEISQQLLHHGLPEDWPVLFVEKGTLKDQRQYLTNLKDMAACAQDTGLQAPALIYVGQVVRQLLTTPQTSRDSLVNQPAPE